MKGNVVVVGGGIAGIFSALLYSNKGFKVTLLEKENEIGGLLRSQKLFDEELPFDYGTHFLRQTGNKEIDSLPFKNLDYTQYDYLKSGSFYKGLYDKNGFLSDNKIENKEDALDIFPCDYVIRVTGDCPVVSADLLDELIEEQNSNTESEYIKFYSGILPIGIGGEIMTSQSIDKLISHNLNFEYSEYMTYYFINNPHVFNIVELTPPTKYNYPNYRLTLDYIEDLHMFEKLFEFLPSESHSSLDEVIKVLNRNPEISDLNSHLTLKFQSDHDLVKKLNKATIIN